MTTVDATEWCIHRQGLSEQLLCGLIEHEPTLLPNLADKYETQY
jgi:hypothetical protein